MRIVLLKNQDLNNRLIIKKYKETCLFCSKQEGTFEACHIFEVKNILSLSEAESDNLLNSLQLSHIDESSNFLSLCSVCHTMFDDFKLTCPKYNEDQNTITLEVNSNIDRHHSTNKTQTIYDLEKYKSLEKY